MSVRWESTRIDLFRPEGRYRVVRTAYVRAEGAWTPSEEDVTPEAYAGERDGGFVQAYREACAMSAAGEMAQVRMFGTGRRLRNMYRVEVAQRRSGGL